jgi:hypothetical protein
MIEIVPPAPDPGIQLLGAFAATTAGTSTAAIVSGAAEAMVKVAVAIEPALMRLLLPNTMHTV